MAGQSTDSKERNVSLEKIRNIGIIAHIDAGKTTTTERILYYTGKTYKLGDIDEGTTQMDWMPQEKERGITIMAAATTTFWHGTRINIIDTPGHVDFTAEVERSLRVLDGGVTVLDAEEGVQSQSETVWHQADKYKVPRICFINKMDKLGADFHRTVKMIKDRLGANPAVMTLPIGKEHDFKGIVDLLTQKSLIWGSDEMGAEYEIKDEIPADMKKDVETYRHKLIEQICENDDSLLEKYLEGKEPDLDELKKALRQATIAYKLVPIYAGSSLRNKGVQPLLNAIVDYLPSPLDIVLIKGVNPKTNQEEVRKTYTDQPFSALAFKIQLDPHVGKLTYMRIYSGRLNSGSYTWNTTKGKQERIGRLLLMHANQREDIQEALAGEIVAIVGLKDTGTGDTLSDPQNPILLEQISFPEPVISLAIEPKTKADQEKMGQALQKLAEEDPTFIVKSNLETGQTIIWGMGELHLEVLVDRMKREFKVDANVGAPQVAYKETIKSEASGEGKYIRQTGGRGQYGHCLLRVGPKSRGEGYEFVNAIKGAAIPNEFIPSVQKGVKEALEKGVLAGYPLVDIKVTLYDGTYHEVDSSDIAFKIAGSIALQNAVKQAGLSLLEPIMKVEVTTPDEFMGTVIGDLSSKRAQILNTEKRGKVSIINALVPLSELSGYATTLRSLSQGRATYYMEPSHYEEVPKNITEKIVASVNPQVVRG
ncbi:translation elongation factor G [Candidatus Gottesmanbacteria bacterium RIFCSPHIGHO2_02_FULL_40_24]|uniref:Elongation factor G n=1 Tax=Candidatus Gottesmanbacteria bacterium RIFCSPHIGHO2_01_FULL_40_15 TaxID=1798376 RepID=A0A1F5Z7A9_9BACT|nr:MAG: translation elongation factor G [Candidatus Gottesmanbacteria bacterium RIFCSPHIGHO2_01_FULL_40_15]OGG18209.1 MAG: translation elongation factor G [Candidatus Gottesmanbacteria bacterium RIFCSPHIGHO2_02_FULL_40_24]OGG22877.1 MAG: translation elongation factor G [Candidatus Gottesmanbacteria bacterium RIFCSPLOWO2_01_FULL_40_10]OGG23493.1 MAG: translation elongation factor G [Candidatus Gottesmanbacteria bacterium RIFCSPHIGHO2_12_FULL_40_13]OGG32506.1 MAG: translation elongation factor G 